MTTTNSSAPIDVRATFGDIDIYVFDQILRGRIRAGMRVFDAGCGGGRNLVFLLRQGIDVSGIDADPEAINAVRSLAKRLGAGADGPAPGGFDSVAGRLPHDRPQQDQPRFRCETLEAHTFGSAWADVVLASAVLHFATDDGHFDRMVEGTWRPLAPGGLFLARLASTVGIEDQVRPLGGGRYRLPDGSDRYLVDEDRLLTLTRRLGGQLADPLKTTIVHGQRSMTTWVVRREMVSSDGVSLSETLTVL
jgi:tellurite methyltransferase